jgi:hypothetical protein
VIPKEHCEFLESHGWAVPSPTETMPVIEQRAAEEQRAVLRVTPERFSSRPAR